MCTQIKIAVNDDVKSVESHSQGKLISVIKEMIILEMSSEKQINFNIRHESSLELENKLESIFEGLFMM